MTLNKRWNWSSWRKLALVANSTHGLITQWIRASERNSVVEFRQKFAKYSPNIGQISIATSKNTSVVNSISIYLSVYLSIYLSLSLYIYIWLFWNHAVLSAIFSQLTLTLNCYSAMISSWGHLISLALKWKTSQPCDDSAHQRMLQKILHSPFARWSRDMASSPLTLKHKTVVYFFLLH